MPKIVLFDRDGTLIVDPPDERVTSIEKIQLFADSLSALKRLAEHKFDIVMITNQAGISEGRITVEEFEIINAEVVKQLQVSGVKILKTYMCPHGPNDGCDCRKPLPKMVNQAIDEFGLVAAETWMIGDHRSDVLAGQAAGTKGMLVKTANHEDNSPEADHVAPTLTDVVDYILANS